MTHPPRFPVVVDASIAIKWLLDEPGTEPAIHLIRQGGPLLAPDLLLVETANVLWKKVRRGDMRLPDLPRALGGLLALDIEVHGSAPLLSRATNLAIEIGHPVYDCLYLALAVETNAPLATADRRLRRAAAGVGIGLWDGL